MSLQTYGGSRNQFCTPPALLEPVYKLFGEVIHLDPCSHPSSIVKARMHVLLPEYAHEPSPEHWEGDIFFGNGLAEEADFLWAKSETAFVNPPFSAVPAWLSRVKRAAADGTEVVVLTNADVSTRWFHEIVWRDANAICFRKGRTRFLGAKSTNPWPHLYSYFGYRGDEFMDIFGQYGACW